MGRVASKRDPAWEHGVQIDAPPGPSGQKYTHVKCNYCNNIYKGGIFRLKHHLAKTGSNVAKCDKVPDDVCQYFGNVLNVGVVNKGIRKDNRHFLVNRGAYMNVEDELNSQISLEGLGVNRGISRESGTTSGLHGDANSNPKLVRGPMDRYIVDLEADMTGSGPSGPSGESLPTRGFDASKAKEQRNKVCFDIGRFLIENGIAFNVVNSPSFHNMIESISKFSAYNQGRAPKPPSIHDIRTWVLKEEVKTTDEIVTKVKRTWPSTGVTIMSDGWKDMRGRQILNFLVNSPEGTIFLRSVDASDEVKDANMLFKLLDDVIEEVGEDNVVQVVTNNASNYKAAGELLMAKRKRLYWTPCAAHCLDLMLEDIYKTPTLKNIYLKARKVCNYIYAHGWVLALMRKYTKRELIRSGATRFATGNLTLESIYRSKDALGRMFTSTAWVGHNLSRTSEGKEIKKIILKQNTFWKGVAHAMKATKPLVRVLKIVDGEKYPPMGFLFGAMEKAKKEIKNNFDGDEATSAEYCKIIDSRWESQKSSHLHGAAAYLNPSFHFSSSVDDRDKSKAKIEYYKVVDKFITDHNEMADLDLELEQFHLRLGLFGRPEAERTIGKRSPAHWWEQFGDMTPNLRRFAIRILSLTCSASGCERNWSTFNQIHTKRRNRLEQATASALVYIMYNKRLQLKKHLRETKCLPVKPSEVNEDSDDECLVRDHIDSDDEWLVDPRDSDDRAPSTITSTPTLTPLDSDWHTNLNEVTEVQAVEAEDEIEEENVATLHQYSRKRNASQMGAGGSSRPTASRGRGGRGGRGNAIGTRGKGKRPAT